MRITPVLSERDNSKRLIVPPTQLTPLRYSWHALGGPEEAELSLTGGQVDVWEAVEWLRCPVTLYDERADAVWWGYVSEVEVTAGALQASVSLQDCYNRVKVGYYRDTDNSHGTTAWVSDSTSIAAYGTIEYLGSMSGSDGMAGEDAAKILAAHKYPLPAIRVGDYREPGARLTCRGWYDTLDWRYYSSTSTTGTAATDLIDDVITSHCQYVTSTQIDNAGTITRESYYELERTCKDVIEELLHVGVDGGNRLLATVTQSRVLRIYEEGTAAHGDYWLSATGQLQDAYRQPYPAERCPVGIWVGLGDLVPLSVNASRLADISKFFVERAEYEPASGRLTLEPRGRRSPWDLVQVEE